ncbi:MAG: 6-phosphogluconate dehydrogenase [Flavobacteriales bacterium]|nr:6-phosphogluconate dehydrogenase [Flavobacteriales bacterium]
MQNTTSAPRTIGSTVKRAIVRVLLVILAVFVLVMLFLYHGSYSKGVRSGVVIKLSERGMVFKTWEGQINLQSFGAVDANGNGMNEVFSFSVESGNDSLLKELEEVSLSGERVNLHYVERYAKLPWRGETTYFVNRVERSGQKVDLDRSPYAH